METEIRYYPKRYNSDLDDWCFINASGADTIIDYHAVYFDSEEIALTRINDLKQPDNYYQIVKVYYVK